MKKNIAFTLAELLIVLLVIGVIAAITIPGIYLNSDYQENYLGLTKAYSTITNATEMLKATKGNPRFWDTDKFYENYMDVLQVACDGNQGKECYKIDDYEVPQMKEFPHHFITGDGIFWASTDYTKPCEDVCALFYIDVNGQKGPNKEGFDIFHFELMKDTTIVADVNANRALQDGKITPPNN